MATDQRRRLRGSLRRGRGSDEGADVDDLAVRWHSTDALPDVDPMGEGPVRDEPIRVRGSKSAELDPPRAAVRRAASETGPSRRSGGRHRVAKRMWAPAPRTPKRGSRRAAVRERRRALRRRLLRRAGPIVVVGGLVAAAGGWWLASSDEPSRRAGALSGAGLPVVTTNVVLAGSQSSGGEATWVTLLSYNPAEDRAAIVYIPAHTAIEVPGRGLQGIGGALTGGTDLLEVAARNLFPGLNITETAELSRAGAEALFSATGPLTVDVPTEVRVGSEDAPRVLFTAGLQELGPGAVADLLYTNGFEDDDVDLGARQLAVWDALFDSHRAAPEGLSLAVRRVAQGAGLSGRSEAALSALFGRMAALPSDRLTLTVLPVEQVGVGGSELYDTDEDELAAFVDQTLTGTHAPGGTTVQVLNGVGTPGLGERVAKALVDDGYRVTLTGNVPGFGRAKTLVVTYDASPDGIAAAERAAELLGVGEVQVSGQGRVSVDLTVVVGKDFLRR